MKPYSLFEAIWQRKVVVIVCFLLVNGVVFAVLRFSERIYEASAWLNLNNSRAINIEEKHNDLPNPVLNEQALRSQVLIGQSEDVIHRAAVIGGANSYYPGQSSRKFRDDIPQSRQIDLIVQNSLKISVEPGTSLMKISYKDINPVFAAKMANATAEALRERYLSLNEGSDTADFFRKQETRHELQLSVAAKELREYEISNRTFSIDEERKLTLRRRDSIRSDLSATLGSVKRLEAQLESLRYQLTALRGRITLPPEIFGSSRPAAENSQRMIDQMGSEPPLLNIRIYQDAAQRLVTSNAELAGLNALATTQKADLAALDQRLAELSDREATYNNLKRRLSTIEGYLEANSKKRADAEAENSWRSNERLSSLQVVQPASQPLKPVFPKATVLIPMGLLGGIALGIATSLMLNAIAILGHQRTQLNERSNMEQKSTGSSTWAT
ncbi:GumC family protein [Methylobacterium longum]|uniref:Lipopolysaccharide biosynthesis protein n=1 Tax=Methylobacterium longum TaxID=767694 RepID=A0ABT8AZ70_9HYPH|nr:hypothetical protein [Methylobacterium longum]MDN3574559.1 hypothetical protein [Methylobacterium longum]GJE15016.1 hypothetical protein FOHLNKBM_6093 [Methylobacterium longum]